MFNEKMVLCGANAYDKKYYLNEQFSNLPEQIADYVCSFYGGSWRNTCSRI